jgi:DNA-binding FadR family transcriptional regulator
MTVGDIENIYSLRLAIEPRTAAFAAAKANDASRAAAQVALSLLGSVSAEDPALLATCTHTCTLNWCGREDGP